MNASIRRLLIAIGFFVTLVLVGSTAYLWLGHGRWRYGDCVYMTIITISTVGFFELKELGQVPGARALTVGLIVSGVGALTYMHLAKMSEEIMGGKMLYVHGDATEDHALIEAGIARARGVVAALTHDKDNLYVTLSARSLNPTARIVSKVVEEEAAPKVLKAGATSLVSPTAIGGRRMASEVIRPEVNEFLDQLLRDKDKNLRLEEIVVPKGSPFIGMAIKDTPIRRELASWSSQCAEKTGNSSTIRTRITPSRRGRR